MNQCIPFIDQPPEDDYGQMIVALLGALILEMGLEGRVRVERLRKIALVELGRISKQVTSPEAAGQMHLPFAEQDVNLSQAEIPCRELTIQST